jgi:CRP/FNR family transcriptional regulator, cyclic AMP receptor protein
LNPLWSNIFRKNPAEETLGGFLGTVPVFSDLAGRELRFLENLVHLRHYHPHESVFAAGDPGSGMYVIRSGRVQIYMRHDNGREEELAQLGPGDFFGETTLTAPAVRSASVRTLDHTELIGLFRADLLEAAQKHPVVANHILFGLTRAVSERLQAAGQEISRLRAQLAELEGARTEAAPAGDS